MTRFSEYRKNTREGHGLSVTQTLPPDARGFQGERAGFPTRLVANVLDVGVAMLVVLGLWVGLWLALIILNRTNEVEMPRFGGFILIGYGFTWLYWTVAWATTGRSIGAWIMGVRVINHAGARLAWGMAALRAAFCIGFPFGLLWVIFSRKNRSLQDMVLRTNVIYDWVLRLTLLTPRPDADSGER